MRRGRSLLEVRARARGTKNGSLCRLSSGHAQMNGEWNTSHNQLIFRWSGGGLLLLRYVSLSGHGHGWPRCLEPSPQYKQVPNANEHENEKDGT